MTLDQLLVTLLALIAVIPAAIYFVDWWMETRHPHDHPSTKMKGGRDYL